MELRTVTMPDSIELEGKKLELNGMGVRLATFFKVQVYIAGLYVEQKSADENILLKLTGPKKVDMQFVRDIDAGKSRNAWEENFTKHCEQYCERFRKQIDQVKAAMVDMAKGDKQSYELTAKGVKIFMRNELKAEIADPEFGTFLLAGWIGPYPPNLELKEGLLGLKKE